MSYSITQACTGCTMCARKCPVGAISGPVKQKHFIDPDLCIECGVCGKVCNFHAVLGPDGEKTIKQLPADWLKPHWEYRKCVACTICVSACPTGAIKLKRQMNAEESKDASLASNGLQETGKHKVIKADVPVLANPSLCIGCSLCAKSCPVSCIAMI